MKTNTNNNTQTNKTMKTTINKKIQNLLILILIIGCVCGLLLIFTVMLFHEDCSWVTPNMFYVGIILVFVLPMILTCAIDYLVDKEIYN